MIINDDDINDNNDNNIKKYKTIPVTGPGGP
jgi:hypothetical protein